MPRVKLGTRRQITIPAETVKRFGLKAGEELELVETDEGILMKPVVAAKPPAAARLTPKEQRMLEQAKAKIAVINTDITAATGLTKEEARVAAKVGLIDPDQTWWWLESWQQGEREAAEDLKAGRVSGPFESVEELIRDLRPCGSSTPTVLSGTMTTSQSRSSEVLTKHFAF